MIERSVARRLLIDQDPFVAEGVAAEARSWGDRCHWPAHWVGVAVPVAPVVVGYRLAWRSDVAETIRVHVSADERYELHLDGVLIGRGSDRGDLDHWNFESYDLDVTPGDHLLAARVWSVGEEAPYAQLSLGHGFLLAAEGRPALSTGTGGWEAAVLPGHGFAPRGAAWGCGLKTEIDGRVFPWGWAQGEDDLTWAPVVQGLQACSRSYANEQPANRLLVPTILPVQGERDLDGGWVRLVTAYDGGPTTAVPIRLADSIEVETTLWQELLDGGAVTIPPRTRRRVLIDLEVYTCAYPRLRLQGGRDAAVRVHWQEALLAEDGRKGDRDEIEGKRFCAPGHEAEDGVGDRFVAGGGDETFTTLWWEAGRYVELTVQTAAEPLTVVELRFTETRYPYEDLSEFSSSDDRLERVRRLGFRTLQMCSHETTMDCPYYEQLQYAGDTRIQCLVAYVTSGDDRLARQALLAFDHSRSPRGLTASRYPSRIRQIIPPFSLWWIAMVHDFALWRGDLDFVRSLMPGVRAVLDAHRAQVGADGLLVSLDGWNFTDWVEQWPGGTPPGAQWAVSGPLNLQLAHVAALAAELEGWVGEDLLATHHQRLAVRVRTASELAFWSPEQGLYADDPSHERWSEHAQCLAVLAGAEHGTAALVRVLDPTAAPPDLARTSVYFDYYLFEALGRIGRVEEVLARFDLWFGLLDQGLQTVIEAPEPTRSDCHAWGAHPIFHLAATVIGIRPTSPAMATVQIRPQLGGLARAATTIPTPYGLLRVSVDGPQVTTEAPAGMVVT